MKKSKSEDDALVRMRGVLTYVEQLIKLDEKVARKLDQHRLPDGTQFILHQHELHGLPGLHLDDADGEGSIWLRMERLTRTRPPEPSENFANWIVISNDPDKICDVKETHRQRVSVAEKDQLLQTGFLFEDETQPSLNDEPDKDGKPQHFDIAMRLDRRPELGVAIDTYRAELWAVWAEMERPRRKSIAVYQRLFEIAQSLTAGNLDQSELVWGMGLSKWRKQGVEIDLPILCRSVEIQILDDKKAEIVVRPRDRGAQVELRAFQALAPAQFNMAENATRHSLKSIESAEPEGVSPFRSETFEPILKLCSGQLDPEGRYLPEHIELPPSVPVPAPQSETLTVSDRFVLFARRRTMNVVVADIERLKSTLSPTDSGDDAVIKGAARTLVLGPSDGSPSFKPLGPIGTQQMGGFDPEPTEDPDHGDLFFPKPFNDDQVSIILRLEKSDGLVVQGPPGTGKTHTIANVISHMLAKGRRVLVISHGETALSVVREQLPDKLRDLAISITTSDRDGERQIEKAVSLMLQIVNDYSSNNSAPFRRIAAIEQEIVNDRKKLGEIDLAIARIAALHLSNVPGNSETPFELAKKLMAEREDHAWFPDRPGRTVEQVALNSEIVEAGLAARRELKGHIKYLDALLPSITSLPDRTTLENWRMDLLRAKEIEAGASHAGLTRRIIAKLAVPGTQTLLSAVQLLLSSWSLVEQEIWGDAIFKLGSRGDARFNSVRDRLDALSTNVTELGARAQAFLMRNVMLPVVMPPTDELHAILGALANNKNPFSLLAFKLKKYQPAIEAITINGARPAGADDWRHVSSFVALQYDLDELIGRWNSTCSALQIESNFARWSLSSVAPMGKLLQTALKLPRLLRAFQEKLINLVEDETEIAGLIGDREKLEGFAKALSARLSQTRLAAVRAQVEEARAKIPSNDVDLNRFFREVLGKLDDPKEDEAQLLQLWEQLVSNLDFLRARQNHFEAINLAAQSVAACGAPDFAKLIRAEPYRKDDDPIRDGWQAAWNWWAQYRYLTNIGAQNELATLHRERVDTEARLRSNFAVLVRERAFYALAGSMPGLAKSALKAFADLIRKLGKGTGKKAAMHRRELRSAMQQCYGAVPCWIMPAWRVSEQLPSELGSFDLVILDEASQSDARELPALLRGEKVLIVGDDRQISPNDAFIKQDDIERLQMNYLKEFPFPTHLLPGSSIYDLARVMFPDKFVMLKEHFRCVEPIIRFSMQFYNEPLIPLRVPTTSERLDPPLIDIFVEDGQRHKSRKINQREAEVIVDEIEVLINDFALSHVRGAQERPRSIGVISLIGGEQARLIQKMVIDRIGEPKFIEHRIICGDSATMQGNERDIVFLSMVQCSTGRISSQTAEQYRRRFNVALSRARDRMILVRSVDESRLNPNDLKARVIQHFRDPMPVAAAPSAELIELCQSSFEREIFIRLTGRGYTVLPQVGSLGYSIDLVVEGSNGRRLAIECDGDRYHGPERWADDMRRQRILERVGWIFWRVFGSTYSLDPDGVLDDLIQTLERLGITPEGTAVSAARWTEHRTISPSIPILVTEASDKSHSPGQIEPLTEPVPMDVGLIAGDRIVLRYIDKPDARPISYVITNEPSDPMSGLLHIRSPLAKHLAEIDVGDEFVFQAGGSEQRILFVAKQSMASMAAAAE